MRGLIPRTKRGNVYRMKWRDLTTAPSYLAAVGIIPAIVPFDLSRLKIVGAYLAVATVIVVFNWFIGSRWAVTLSQLAKVGNSNPPASKGNAPLSL